MHAEMPSSENNQEYDPCGQAEPDANPGSAGKQGAPGHVIYFL